MLDMKFLRENPDLVKENIKKKYQDEKLPLVDEVIALDAANRAAITEASELRAKRNALSKANGPLFGKLKKAEGDEKAAIQAQIDENMAAVKANDARLAECEKLEGEYEEKIHKIMLLIPNIIDPSVPIGRDDSENVEVERFGEPRFAAAPSSARKLAISRWRKRANSRSRASFSRKWRCADVGTSAVAQSASPCALSQSRKASRVPTS